MGAKGRGDGVGGLLPRSRSDRGEERGDRAGGSGATRVRSQGREGVMGGGVGWPGGLVACWAVAQLGRGVCPFVFLFFFLFTFPV